MLEGKNDFPDSMALAKQLKTERSRVCGETADGGWQMVVIVQFPVLFKVCHVATDVEEHRKHFRFHNTPEKK